MRSRNKVIITVAAVILLAAAAATSFAQPFDAKYTSSMHWRMIGPFRGGRTRAAAGVPSRPHVFYIGVCNGGVWKTTDAGRTWDPIFDREPTGSIGAIAVSLSNPDIVYVGSGEGLQRPDLSVGDGIYKSTDAGRTWTHLGLRDGQQIPQLIVDPRNPDRLFAAVLGHPYGPNPERGIFRSTDGGQTFEKVLFKDENTGGSDLAFEPGNPNTVYACLWESRQGPWENAEWSGTGGGIYKSTDGGTTWLQLTKGLPTEGVVQANLAIAPSNPKRIYAAVATAQGTGLYRSDDAGENWARITADPRPGARIGGGDLPRLAVNPKDADIVFSDSVVTWKSVDGGKTWTGLRGAPGGDDYQNIWINPDDPEIMLITGDQGAIITLNGGQTWSSWYNQPTAQMFHVAADNAFPYRVSGGQQESGSACVSSRGNDGQITFREWHPVGVDEYGYAAPDPLDPDIVYGGNGVSRYDRRTGQVQTVGPRPSRSADYRTIRTQPVLFSPIDAHILYFAANTLWKTNNGGQSWEQISPDLTRKTWDVPAVVGKYRGEETAKPGQRGVIYTIAPSYIDVNRLWVGTDDGLIHLTVDGGLHWTDVTPPGLTPWAKVCLMDAGHFDAQTAYAAINTLRLDDMNPHVYRTHDAGKTWTHINSGLPEGAPVNVIREDPKRKGLLFAGTEREVFVSFDDGDHWQSLRLNMPATSMRDLVIKDDDLVVATHGRGFWILDDITPLRQLTKEAVAADAVLFAPQVAMRVRWDTNTDTPLPPDEPGGENPPDGAIIDYALKSDAVGPVTLEVLDSAGNPVRRYASDDPVEPPDPMLTIPTYWVRPPQVLSAAAGMHRFLWDMHYQPMPGARSGYSMAAIYRNTGPSPTSLWAMPGAYTLKLTVGGKSSTQPLTVKMDPRVTTSPADLLQQFKLSKEMFDGMADAGAAGQQLRSIRAQVKSIQEKAAQGPAADALASFDKKAGTIQGSSSFNFRRGGFGAQDTLAGVGGMLGMLMRALQAADVAPTTQMLAAVGDGRKALETIMGRWTVLKTQDLAGLNAQLKEANLPLVEIK